MPERWLGTQSVWLTNPTRVCTPPRVAAKGRAPRREPGVTTRGKRIARTALEVSTIETSVADASGCVRIVCLSSGHASCLESGGNERHDQTAAAPRRATRGSIAALRFGSRVHGARERSVVLTYRVPL